MVLPSGDKPRHGITPQQPVTSTLEKYNYLLLICVISHFYHVFVICACAITLASIIRFAVHQVRVRTSREAADRGVAGLTLHGRLGEEMGRGRVVEYVLVAGLVSKKQGNSPGGATPSSQSGQ